MQAHRFGHSQALVLRFARRERTSADPGWFQKNTLVRADSGAVGPSMLYLDSSISSVACLA